MFFNRFKQFVIFRTQGLIKYAAGKRRFVIPGIQGLILLVIVTTVAGRTRSAAAMNSRFDSRVEISATLAASDQELIHQAQWCQNNCQQQYTQTERREQQILKCRNFLSQLEEEGRIPPALQGAYFNFKQRLESFDSKRPCSAAIAKQNSLAVEWSDLLYSEQTMPINQRNDKKAGRIRRELVQAEKRTTGEEEKMGRLERELTGFVNNVCSRLNSPNSERLIDRIRPIRRR